MKLLLLFIIGGAGGVLVALFLAHREEVKKLEWQERKRDLWQEEE